MIDDDAYFIKRATRELELARHATDRAVTWAHQQLADAYLAKLPPEPIQANGS